MKDKKLPIPTRFRPATRFVPPLAVRGAPPSKALEVERLKSRLLDQLLQGAVPAHQQAPMRRAANEAAALAFATPFPLLVLPVLLEEKAAAARRQAEQQQRVLERSRAFALRAA